MATDIIARGMITEYKSGTNISFTENEDGSVTISASGDVSSEDTVARETINNHKLDKNNPHNVTAEQIGLGNVDNTSDLDKPISTAVQQAIDNKADKTVATTSADGLMSAEDKGKLDDADNTYALKSKYGDTTIDVGRKADTTIGMYSTAEGYYTTASGNGSHAEGYNATASGQFSHAEGRNTTASGMCSHAGGTGTKALHENEVAYGKYNESKDDTVFSVGDGTADDARHNAFEITTSGGKLHDKNFEATDISPDLSAYAKTADVPNIKVNSAVDVDYATNAGNANTVDGLHADDFVNATDYSQIQIPNNVDVPAWIYTNGKRFQRYMTNGGNTGLINVPDNSTDYVWYWYDGLNILARENSSGKYYICDMINGGFSGWKDIYTSKYKPYISGDATVAANSTTCTSNHGFTPSAAIWWDGNMSGVAVSFNDTQFTINNTSAVDRTVYYLIFK